MPMTLVKGHYRIVGASPDGDSVRFCPLDPGVWEAAGMAVRTNSTGGVQLRLDAIDALETHYTPPHTRSPWHQPAALGDGAASALLDLLGFRNVVRDDRGYVTTASPEQTHGYILTRFADKYGRAVATAFPGGRRGRAADGSTLYLDADELHRSVNHQMLATGWVYPTFYSKLYVDLRDDLATTAVAARTAGGGCGQRTPPWKASGCNPGHKSAWTSSSCRSCSGSSRNT